MSAPANPLRGEASLRVRGETLVLRPSFQALVSAEEELGSLLALIERAAAGKLTLAEIAALLWHCLKEKPRISREEFAEALAEAGLKALAPALRRLIGQILKGL